MQSLPATAYGYGFALLLSVALLFTARSTGRASLYSALYLLGHATALELLYAGPAIHYEHYRPTFKLGQHLPGEAWDVPLLVVLGAHALFAVFSLWRQRQRVVNFLREQFGFRLLLILMALGATAAFPTPQPVPLVAEFLFGFALRLAELAYVVLAMLALPEATRERVLEPVRSLLCPPGAERSALRDPVARFSAAFTFVVAALLALLSYQAHPHIPDEMAYVIQSRYFAAGRLWIEAPPVPEAIEAYLFDCQEGRCYSVFPPGFPAALALGQLLRVPFLVNPFLGALNVLLAFSLVQRLYDRTAARLTALLMAGSPWLLFMAMSYMSHTFSLTLGLTAALCTVRGVLDGRSLLLPVAGGAIGLTTLTRPLEGVMLVVVLGPLALLGAGRIRLVPPIVMGLSCVAVCALNLPYNEQFTGAPTKFPVMEYMEQYWGAGINSLGFGPDKGVSFGGLDPFPGHGLKDVIVNGQLNTTAIQIDMFGWGLGSLLPLLVLLTLRRSPLSLADRVLLAFIATVVGIQSLYWFSGGPDFAARYWFLISVPLIALSARGLLAINARLPPDDAARLSVPGAALGLTLLALVTLVPFRAVDKYYHFRFMQPGFADVMEEHELGGSVVLVRGLASPDYTSALPYIPVNPGPDTPLVLRDKNERIRAQLKRAHADATFYFVDGPSLTGDTYVLSAGPLRATDEWPELVLDPQDANRPQ